ncbi:MAG: amidophosphoribosyltransferase [Alphaproteobacteria bacterium]
MVYTVTIKTHPFDDDKLREECGVFGVFGHKDAAALTALGLHALQHRGQEAAGIVTYDGKQYHGHRSPGHVGDIFGREAVIKRLPGNLAVGHNRYSTTGETAQRNIQPLFAEFESGGFALAHNGNLTNAQILHRDLVKRGCLFQSTTDTEVIIHLIAISDQGSVVDRLIDTLKRVVGAYSLVAMTNDKMIGVRDPMGVRPLVLGYLDGAHVLASESCALDIIGADFVRDVEPGEMVVIDKDGLTSLKPFGWTPSRLCVFEYIYFARPDSIVDGSGVYEARKRIGAELARESHAGADVVIPVPDSGVPSAMGYANETGLPYELGIIRNHYVGRTFIEPADHIRHLGVKLKHNASRAVIEGKRVVLVDDSIVRGTTSVKIVEMMRNAGAKEVHMRISSPPTTHSCFYGVDTPERDQLLAAQHSVEEMRKFMGADSLAFVSIEGLYRAMGQKGRNEQTPQYCDACFTGEYPVSLIDREGGETIPQLSFLTNLG